MNISLKTFLLPALIALTAPAIINAQGKISYRDLAENPSSQSTFFDTIALPGDSTETVQFLTLFRFNYATLPFKKVNSTKTDNRFYSTASLSIEVFEGKEENRDSRKNISIEGLEAITRATWKDTAFTASYQQTKSNHIFMGGTLPVQLEPGYYHYILQLTRGDDAREQTSRTQSVEIVPFDKRNMGNFVLVDSINTMSTGKELSILNFGGNVYYGEDFYALIHLPGHSSSSSYSVNVTRIDIAESDTTARNNIYRAPVDPSDIYPGYKPVVISNRSNPTLDFSKDPSGYDYALVQIPNSSFPNAIFRISVEREGRDQPIAQEVFRSKWIDMPTSLLNLNVAIDMLRFIADRETIRNIGRGNETEKETKFRNFWKQRDPTPKTEFNELLAEYYRRIDYAYDNFTTINTTGFESDRGKIYIKYGAPDNIERKFPPGEETIEIWTYGSKQFVFQAISGFGDFRLVSSE